MSAHFVLTLTVVSIMALNRTPRFRCKNKQMACLKLLYQFW